MKNIPTKKAAGLLILKRDVEMKFIKLVTSGKPEK
jgi:hypothetical protein